MSNGALIDRRDLELLSEKFGQGQAFENAKERVVSGEPLAYVIGEWYFYGLTFLLDSSCLIPRPDTEHVVDKAIEVLPKGGFFIDLCTGSGCIAVSVLKHRPDLTALGIDISEGALAKARENAAKNGVGDRLTLIQGDVFKLTGERLPLCDAIISNPPYIRSDVVPTLEVAKSEPVSALDGGEDGLDFYRHILSELAFALKKDGAFIFEIGYDQAEQILDLAKENGASGSVFKDYGGNDRVFFGKRTGAKS